MPELKIADLLFEDRPSPNFDARDAAIDTIILHYTGMKDADTALARLCDPAPLAGKYPGPWQAADIDPATPLGKASSHYVVDDAGVVHRLVPEVRRAWHAGVSSWKGESNINARSIGIEIVNGGHDYGLPDFTEVQVEAVIALVKDIRGRWDIPLARVLGHSDIAPLRKNDPGEKFPWARLVEAGAAKGVEYVAMQAGAADAGHLQSELKRIGYGVELTGAFDDQTRAVIAAFQRRYRQGRVDGAADEETQVLIASVAHGAD